MTFHQQRYGQVGISSDIKYMKIFEMEMIDACIIGNG